jgi:transposase
VAVGITAGAELIGEATQIWLAVMPVDMRRGIDGLSMIVQEALGQAPCSGMAFVFRNKAGNRLRLLVWDGNGVWLCQRRLHRGGFVWPKVTDASFYLSRAQWEWLVAGVDWQRLSRLPNPDWHV